MHVFIAFMLAAFLLGGECFAQKTKATPKEPKPSDVIAPYPPNLKTEFLTSCVGLHKEMIPACKCMILTFEKAVPLKDYLEIANAETPAEDPRFKNVANACLRRLQTTR